MATFCPRRNKQGKLIGWLAKIRKLGETAASQRFPPARSSANWAFSMQ
jgi:hypothetical protein